MKSFPLYTQYDSMDCGPACLRMVAKYYGKSYSFGGCPHKRIENKINGKCNDVCIHHKDNLNEYITQYISMIK